MSATDPRYFMELAISEMRKSIPEKRRDGKVLPKVGAILVHQSLRDRTLGPKARSFRGEFRDGDHAEYTLLERKNADQALDEYVLFVTLEPCSPSARSPHKLGCAERIVLARIREVWIGIEDPDPMIDGKGIQFLRANGVIVHLFDPDLQHVIRSENRDFISQALHRAENTSDSLVNPVPPNRMESAVNATVHDYSQEALDSYLSKLKSRYSDLPDSVESVLQMQGLAVHTRGELVPTEQGLLLFGSAPRMVIPHAGMLGKIQYEDGSEEIEDFDGPLISIPDNVHLWLTHKIPRILNRTLPTRSSPHESITTMVREGVVNALVHRDYSIPGQNATLSFNVTRYK